MKKTMMFLFVTLVSSNVMATNKKESALIKSLTSYLNSINAEVDAPIVSIGIDLNGQPGDTLEGGGMLLVQSPMCGQRFNDKKILSWARKVPNGAWSKAEIIGVVCYRSEFDPQNPWDGTYWTNDFRVDHQ